jgi:hypothetical protein
MVGLWPRISFDRRQPLEAEISDQVAELFYHGGESPPPLDRGYSVSRRRQFGKLGFEAGRKGKKRRKELCLHESRAKMLKSSDSKLDD